MLNRIEIIGHLGRDPESRTLPSGNAVCNFTVATTEKWKDKNSGQQMEETEWHRVSVFDKLAEICGQYLAKGSLVYISGKLKTRKYTDANGVEKSTTEITCNEMKMLGGRPQQDDQGQQGQQRQAPQGQQRQASNQGNGGGNQGSQGNNRNNQGNGQGNNQQRQAPPQQRQAAPRQDSGGFSDMDDDIPF